MVNDTIDTSVRTILASKEYEQLKKAFMDNSSQATSYAKNLIKLINQISGEDLDTDFFKHPLLRKLYRDVITNASPAASGVKWELKKFLNCYHCDLSDPFFSKQHLDENESDTMFALASSRIKSKIMNKMVELQRDNYPFSRVELLELLNREFPSSKEKEILNAVAVFLKDPMVTKMSYGKYIFKTYERAELSKEFILDAVLEAIEKIKLAEITCVEEMDINEVKKLGFMAGMAEHKLKMLLEEFNNIFNENDSDINR